MLLERRGSPVDTLTGWRARTSIKRAMAALSSGHMAVDFAGGVLRGTAPVFWSRSGISRTRRAASDPGFVGLGGAAAVRALVRPSRRRLAAAAGVAIGAIGMGLAALSPS